MKWHQWFRRRGAGEALGGLARSGEGISLEEERAIDLGLVRDLYALLAAIEELQEEAVLYLEGTSIVSDIRAFLEAQGAEESQPVGRGTSWPRPKIYHLPLTRSNLRQLRELAEGHAEPEICDHLVVYSGNQILLSAYDAGSSHVYVSRDLSPAMVERIRRRLGVP
ncbi:MAG: hypothetical protein ACRDGU_09730 [Actinomycetota bacterium]